VIVTLVSNQQEWEVSAAVSHDAKREVFRQDLIPHLRRLIEEGTFDD
jgi:hypothetical protein